jgi:hypothetical protein
MALDTNLLSAFAADNVRAFVAVQIALPATANAAAYTIRLIDGAGTVTFPVDGVSSTFAGSDDTFGSLKALSTISEAVASEAPATSLSLLSPTIGQISDPRYQGAPVRIWTGAVNEATGNTIGQPEELYRGWLDVATTTQGQNAQETALAIGSVWEKMFVASEGQRLNATWHRANFPAEGGLDNAQEASGTLPWGVEGATTAAVNYNASVRAVLNWMYPGLS